MGSIRSPFALALHNEGFAPVLGTLDPTHAEAWGAALKRNIKI